MKKLVLFYSRADENFFGGEYRYVEVGNTEKAANMIVELTGADRFKIEQKVPYAKEYKVCVGEAVRDFKAGARPELVNFLDSIAEYDEIYLGYPNYCGTMPMAVYTFLEHYDWSGKVIHPFCTNEGSGMGNSEKDILNTAKGASLGEGLSILGREVEESKEKLANWLVK